tara:strand:- start:856 stop:1293 length:438 start_codon:yes stop_codon:yes gene_type:complete
MANSYDGEIDITLYNKIYPMRINMHVIAQYQSTKLLDGTTPDFMSDSIKALNALRRVNELDPMDQAEVMTTAVSMERASYLFFYAAKEMDSTVIHDEMQENVIYEGPMQRVRKEKEGEFHYGYPVLFANLVMFSIFGVTDNVKKH